MRTKFRAAIASMLVAMVAAGAAVMPATSSAHGNTGPLCHVNELYTGLMLNPAGPVIGYLVHNEPFRIKETVVFEGHFYSLGHGASTYPADYWVYTPHLRCQ